MATLSELVDVMSNVENESLHVYNECSILLGRLNSKMSRDKYLFRSENYSKKIIPSVSKR